MKTRFCPSPTGDMHVGNVRTALFNYLSALAAQGVFLLRVEDTDKTRSQTHFTESMLVDLKWLGLHWQEGAEAGGDKGPYYQSQRQAIYDDYYNKLTQTKQAYPCFCSEQQLKLDRKMQRASGKPPRYLGTCRGLDKKQIEEKLSQGLKPTLRFAVPAGERIEFTDLVRQQQAFNTDDIGDFIIRRADETAPFLFCNAIDDALMGVTHVLRGEDHLTNTPRQIMILQALGLRIPQYAHISLIIGDDNKPLSKRNGSRSVTELRTEGYLPEAVINYLARLGQTYTSDNVLPLAELAKEFEVGRLHRAPARFSFDQLTHWQKLALAALDDKTLWTLFSDNVRNLVSKKQQDSFVETIRGNIVFAQEADQWAIALMSDHIDYDESAKTILKNAGESFFHQALQALAEHGETFSAFRQDMQQKHQLKGKALFLPLRMALTAQQDGPELAKIFTLMGAEKIKNRLTDALNTLC